MDGDEIAGGATLDRGVRDRRLDASGRAFVPQRVPETRPTPLQGAFVNLSVVVLCCGVVAIMALELGVPMVSLLVKVPVLVGGTVLLALTADALIRVWRSALAWLPVDRGRGLFRFVWAAALAGSLVAVSAIVLVVLAA